MQLERIDERLKLIKQINSEANRKRKQESLYKWEVYKNKLKPHVQNHLRTYLSANSLKQMSLVHSIGMCERIVNQEASIYEEAPKREWLNLTDKQSEAIKSIYWNMDYDEKSKIHNRYFKLQHQAVSQILPKKGKLIKKLLLEHQYDIIENPSDPESPLGFILSSNSKDSKPEEQKYVVWTLDHHFLMDGKGKFLSEETINPIGMLPFIVACKEKNGTFYPDDIETSVDFTVLLNAAFTEMYHIMRMQGFGQAVITGPKRSMPKAEQMDIGVNSVIALITEDGATADFKFVNANPDLSGSIEVISTLLSAFLSSKGLDPKTINLKGESGASFSSGWERFLAMIDDFKATKDDLAVFKSVEEYEFDVIRAWHNAALGSKTLDSEYLSSTIPDTAKIKTAFYTPEMVMTEPERILSVKATEDNGYISHIEAIKRVHNLDSIEEAEAKYSEIQASNEAFPRVEVKTPEAPKQWN